MPVNNFSSLCMRKNNRTKRERRFNVELCDYELFTVPNEDYEKAPPLIQYALKRIDQDMGMMLQLNRKWDQNVQEKHFLRYVDLKTILDYLKIVPFTPSVFITVCPPWRVRTITADKIRSFRAGIEKYLKECMNGAGYSKWKYVLECGSSGHHLHAHIWAQINPLMEKSMYRNGKEGRNSHIRKGKHLSYLRQKIERSCVEGVLGVKWGDNSITSSMCLNEEVAKDKQLYLIESEKPEDHKNASHKHSELFGPFVFET